MIVQEPEKLIFFLHIPKAAGSTLSQILRRQYGAARVLDSYPATFRKKIHGKNALESARWRYDYFAALPEANKRNADVFMGHEGFGFHRALERPCTYITILRDPVDRVLSHYYYIRQNQKNRMHEAVMDDNMDLAEFVSSGISNEVDNSQTKFLAGLETPYLKAGEYGDEILQMARQNLRTHFAVVGLTERFDESLILLKRTLGWQHWPFYVPANVTRKRPHHQQIARETRELIQEANRLDSALYQFAQAQFEARRQQQDSSFQKELETFQRLNKAYALWSSSISALRSSVRRLLPVRRET
ncbi:MAG: sulfotransferase family 2 domain-containing protein [Anaerolineaceae bacterium]|nr:sulfotransferase family 2 domain-containing protein [Anaerolineaceae bacterium]